MTITRRTRTTQPPAGTAPSGAYDRQRHLTRASTWLAATGLALVGTLSSAPTAAGATVATPEDLFRSAAANATHGSNEASAEIAAALEAAAAREIPSARGAGTVATMTEDPEHIAFDYHQDGDADSDLETELTGAVMAVYPDEPDSVYFYGYTWPDPSPSDVAFVELDTDEDGFGDLITLSPEEALLAEGPKVTAILDEDLNETGQWAGWIRTEFGYAARIDRAELGLSATRFVFGLSDPVSDRSDLAPDRYEGRNIRLAVPRASSTVTARAGNGNAVVSWVAPHATDEGVTGYKVTASPGGRSCTTSGATSCTVTGLTNGVGYTFTVSAINIAGSGAPSVASAAVTPRLPVRVTSAKAGYGNVLAVNVDPSKSASASYIFQVQKKTATGAWATLPTKYATQGTGETRSVTLGAGTFRAYVPASGAYGAAVSREVRLSAPVVKVAAGRDSKKSKIVVNVNPDKGSGYWTFKLQQRRSNGTWSTLSKTYKTSGSGETRKINKSKGMYRVVVAGKYGYLGTVSGPVTLVK